MRYKISHFSQSHSHLYVRNVEPNENGLFDCLIFIGTRRICLNDVFNFTRMFVEDTEGGDGKLFYFDNSMNHSIVAGSLEIAQVRDFPDVKVVQVVGETETFKGNSWP